MTKRRYFFQKYSIAGVFCFLFLLPGLGVQSLQAEVTASATLNANTFPMDRVATFSITAQGIRSFQPQIPEVDGLRFHQRGQSTQMQLINGDYSVSVTSVYLVEALRVGSFTIPAIQIQSKEGTTQTEPIQFEVTVPQTTTNTARQQQSGSSSTSRLRSGEADKVAFMRVTPSKKKSYSGEVVPVEIKVYFRDGMKVNLNSLPQLTGEGFVLQQLEREPIQTSEAINNSRYMVLTWESALSGIKEGEHKLSLEVEATLLLREQRQRSLRGHSMFSDPFFGDSFFDDFFGSYREKDVKVASPELAMSVLSLPEEGRPEGFSGAIGDFQLQVEADPVELDPGDPITLTMTVSGQGNFDRVQAPQLGEEKGWKTYTPSSEFLKDGAKGSGKKVFEQALVAKDPNIKEIPAVVFSYFDPTTAAYKVLRSAPIPLTTTREMVPLSTEPAAVGKEEQLAETETPVALGQAEMRIKNLAPLQVTPGDTEQELRPLFMKKWFQLLFVLLLVCIVVAGIYKIRAARYANNPRLQRDQKMKNFLEPRLRELDQSLAAKDTRGFLATCRTAIQEQLGLLWKTEGAAITVADLQKRLPGDSILVKIFSAAEESAYGGQELSSQQMQEFADGMKKELDELR
ncbi:MAG: BatD family protein [Desulfocapsa sp.]|nr:BatD family protein [Desulfocapsa sp.]